MAFVSARIVKAYLGRNVALEPIRLDVVAEIIDDERAGPTIEGVVLANPLRAHHVWVGQDLAGLLALAAPARRTMIRETMRVLLRAEYRKWKQEQADQAIAPQEQDMSSVPPFEKVEVDA